MGLRYQIRGVHFFAFFGFLMPRNCGEQWPRPSRNAVRLAVTDWLTRSAVTSLTVALPAPPNSIPTGTAMEILPALQGRPTTQPAQEKDGGNACLRPRTPWSGLR